MQTDFAEQIVNDFEQGRLSRRALIAQMTALAAVATGGGRVLAQTQPAEGPTFQATDLDHIALRVTDVDRSIAFYQKHLGLRGGGQGGRSAFLSPPGGQFVLALFKGDTAGLDHYCYRINRFDPDAAAQRLEAAVLLRTGAAIASTSTTRTASKCRSRVSRVALAQSVETKHCRPNRVGSVVLREIEGIDQLRRRSRTSPPRPSRAREVGSGTTLNASALVFRPAPAPSVSTMPAEVSEPSEVSTVNRSSPPASRSVEPSRLKSMPPIDERLSPLRPTRVGAPVEVSRV